MIRITAMKYLSSFFCIRCTTSVILAYRTNEPFLNIY